LETLKGFGVVAAASVGLCQFPELRISRQRRRSLERALDEVRGEA
jgi:hypothetical protein